MISRNQDRRGYIIVSIIGVCVSLMFIVMAFIININNNREIREANKELLKQVQEFCIAKIEIEVKNE